MQAATPRNRSIFLQDFIGTIRSSTLNIEENVILYRTVSEVKFRNHFKERHWSNLEEVQEMREQWKCRRHVSQDSGGSQKSRAGYTCPCIQPPGGYSRGFNPKLAAGQVPCRLERCRTGKFARNCRRSAGRWSEGKSLSRQAKHITMAGGESQTLSPYHLDVSPSTNHIFMCPCFVLYKLHDESPMTG